MRGAEPVFKDIREASEEEYWEALRVRWAGLLSYRYLGRNHSSLNTGPVDNTMKLRHDMRNPAGGIMAAPICIASPEGGGISDDVGVPNPVIHSLQILDDARDVARIEVLSEVVRTGRQMSYSRSRIVDADDHQRVIAFTEGQGVSLADTPGGFEKMDIEGIEVEDSPELPPLWKVFGAERRDDGHWALPELRSDLASPDAALHLGPQHVVLEAAASDAAARLAGTERLQVQTWHVMFVSRGKVGPFRVATDAMAGSDGRVGVRMLLHDEGNGDRAVTSGSGVFRAVR